MPGAPDTKFNPWRLVAAALAIGVVTILAIKVKQYVDWTETNTPAAPASGEQRTFAGTNVIHQRLSDGSIKTYVWKDATTGVIDGPVKIGAAQTVDDGTSDVAIGATATDKVALSLECKEGQSGPTLKIKDHTGQTQLEYVQKTASGTNYLSANALIGFDGTGQTFDGINFHGDNRWEASEIWDKNFNDEGYTRNDIGITHARDNSNWAEVLTAETWSIYGGYYWGTWTDCLRLNAGGRIYANKVDLSAVTITGATWAGGVATFTVSASHQLAREQIVIVAGVDPAGYNGTYHVATVPHAYPARRTFTVALAGDPGGYTSGGTIATIEQTQEGARADVAVSTPSKVITAYAADRVGLDVRAKTSQTAAIQTWSAATGTAAASVGKTGTLIGTNGVRVGTVECFTQDAAPATRNDGSALVADDVWLETDTQEEWYYTGAAWYSTKVYDLPVTSFGVFSGGAATTAKAAPPTDYATIFVIDVAITSQQANAGAADVYYTFGFGHRTQAGVETTLVTGNTQGNASGYNFYVSRTAVNATSDVSAAKVFVLYCSTNTGATGNLETLSGHMRYRLVHP